MGKVWIIQINSLRLVLQRLAIASPRQPPRPPPQAALITSKLNSQASSGYWTFRWKTPKSPFNKREFLSCRQPRSSRIWFWSFFSTLCTTPGHVPLVVWTMLWPWPVWMCAAVCHHHQGMPLWIFNWKCEIRQDLHGSRYTRWEDAIQSYDMEKCQWRTNFNITELQTFKLRVFDGVFSIIFFTSLSLSLVLYFPFSSLSLMCR